MRGVIAFDTETALIRPGCYAPPLVCVTAQIPGGDPCIWHVSDAFDQIRLWLQSDLIIVGHNVAYDLAVLGQEFPELIPLIFKAYQDDRVTDTKIRQQLLDIAAGEYRGRPEVGGAWIKYNYDLASITKRNCGRVLKKDGWRLRYAKFRDVSLDGWRSLAAYMIDDAKVKLAEDPENKDLIELATCTPEEVITYPLEDARSTLDNYLAQAKHEDYLEDQFRQARKAWALHLTSAWGLRTNPAAVEELRKETEGLLAEIEQGLIDAGLVRPDGSRDTKKAAALMVEVCEREGLEIRKTAGGGVSLDSDACKATEDPILEDYAELSTLKAVLAKDVEALKKAEVYPIHTSFGLAESGRTTSSRPNVQNWRRKSAEGGAGIRECFVPRPGHVFIQADYDQLELRTLGQVCVSLFGRSELASALNAGIDPHLALAANILRISYEEAAANRKRPDVDNARQTAKVANFGFPGGLGAQKLILFARKTYGVELDLARANELREEWFERWPEMREFFNYVSELAQNPHGATVKQLFSNRIRGGCRYTAACNSYFQGLGADATGHALWLVVRACYAEPSSPLYGARVVNFVHDEVIAEFPECDRAHEAAEEMARLMVHGANEFLPDVPSKTEPLLMRYWSKDAKRILDERGRLVPWG